ncbi:hypothetical protein BG011_006146 [Mortierella polycephala]|uniref:Uncharacterized protein n=1 Tax=Mortierella polycephala TaxID=41804 RepID=A0A9P6U0F2_9FUNG|nr:hypothetical protein BG011_006146 [Mortierella polycephala]
MPCRAAPPPPPPPHAAQDMTPSTASLSNPLVYRLRTCCLQEFLPRVTLAQKSLPIQVPSIPGTAAIASASASAPTTVPTMEVTNMTNGATADRVFQRSSPTQLSALFNQNNLNFSNLDSPYPHSPSCCCDDSDSLPEGALSGWQPPASAIQLPQLQTTLASRFLSWALSEKVLSQDPQRQQQSVVDHCGTNFEDTTVDVGHNDQCELDKEHSIMINPTLSRKQAQRPIVDSLPECTIARLYGAAQDWTAAHDLIWPEGDYYMAKKIFIREGVAHLKRGRRYIFVEPVLGPAASYLYPKWADSEVEADTDPDAEDDAGVHPVEENVLMDNAADFEGAEATADVHEASALAQVSHSVANDATVVSASELAAVLGHGLEQDREQDDSERAGDDKEAEDDGTEGRAQAGQTNKGAAASLTMEGERVEKEDADETTRTSSSRDVRGDNTNSPPPSSSSSSSSIHLSNHDDDLYASERLEPYSPLLDPSMDGQDQFEYGLYELQFIPKIQYLLPQQFLPTRQSFIVHLDEDRPTLASPVPLHSKRSECRCQLMMRKVLMQRDLLQVWPAIPPVRTLQERMQEAEEEARILEIKQKVKLQTMHWRKALMTQTVACG